MASSAGGMDIEVVAAQNPGVAPETPLEPGLGLTPFQARKLAFGIGVPKDSIRDAVSTMTALVRAYDALDASLAEINPLILTKDGKVYALDAKMNIDDNAMYRHRDLVDLRDPNEEDPLEVEASKYSLNYIKLDGTVGCMVNGAGLAMATMDIIKYAGGSPANFLDVGGGANAEQIRPRIPHSAFGRSVKAVLINIFGGILRCDIIAEGIITAARETADRRCRLIVRLQGTNVERGKELLASPVSPSFPPTTSTMRPRRRSPP